MVDAPARGNDELSNDIVTAGTNKEKLRALTMTLPGVHATRSDVALFWTSIDVLIYYVVSL